MIYQFIGVTMIVFGLLFLVQGIKTEIDLKLNAPKDGYFEVITFNNYNPDMRYNNGDMVKKLKLVTFKEIDKPE